MAIIYRRADEDNSIRNKFIVGSVVGSIGVLFFVSVLLYYFLWYRPRRQSPPNERHASTTSVPSERGSTVTDRNSMNPEMTAAHTATITSSRKDITNIIARPPPVLIHTYERSPSRPESAISLNDDKTHTPATSISSRSSSPSLGNGNGNGRDIWSGVEKPVGTRLSGSYHRREGSLSRSPRPRSTYSDVDGNRKTHRQSPLTHSWSSRDLEAAISPMVEVRTPNQASERVR